MVLGVIGSAVSFLMMSREVWLLLAPFAFLSLAYVLPIIGRKGTKTKLREFGLNKIFSIAAVWAVVTFHSTRQYQRFVGSLLS